MPSPLTIRSHSNIRRATPDDAPALADLGARTFVDTYGEFNTPDDMRTYVERYFTPESTRTELVDPETVVLVLEIDGVMAGYVKLHASVPPPSVAAENALEIARIYVDRSWHGKGLGTALMHACIETARTGGHDALWLGVWVHNARARAFYEKFDFHIYGMTTFQLGSDTQNDYVMVRNDG